MILNPPSARQSPKTWVVLARLSQVNRQEGAFVGVLGRVVNWRKKRDKKEEGKRRS